MLCRLENMAEAAVESPAARFFCHKCTQEISPVLPDYICPRCQCGFIEELTQGPPENASEESDDDIDPFAQVAELWNVLRVLRRVDPEQQNGSGTTENQQGSNENPARPGPSTSRRVRGSRPRWFTRTYPPNEVDPVRQTATGLLQHLVASLAENTGFVANAGFPVFLNLHGNPGDYAWGRGGWNAVITQLMNQLDGTGPPPLPKEKIDEIPVVNISQEQVDKTLQCTVCMEDFKMGEPVKKLSCQHHFHSDCIIPWLELHGTCPICRKFLSDDSSQGGTPTATGSNSSMTDSVSSNSSSEASTSGGSRNNGRRASNHPSSTSGSAFNSHVPSIYDFSEDFD